MSTLCRSVLRARAARGMLALLVAAGSGTPPARAHVYALEVLGPLDGSNSVASGINTAGQVVGTTTAGNGTMHAFLWTKGKLQDLGTLGGRDSTVGGINADGQVVGSSGTASGATHAFLWSKDKLQDLGTLGGPNSQASSINAAGQVVGASETARGKAHAFLWTPNDPGPGGMMQDLGTLGGPNSLASGINIAGQVVGASETAAGRRHAFLWTEGAIQDLGTLGGPNSQASAINADGQVVGWADTAAGPEHAFRWTNGEMQDLGTLGGPSSRGFGLNALGQVVGVSEMPGGKAHAFLATEATGMVDLNTQIDPALGWKLVEARGINDAGQIVGVGLHKGQSYAIRLTPVVAGKLVVVPTRLMFPAIPASATQSQNLVLKNAGQEPVAGHVGKLAAPFQVIDGGGKFSLAPGASLTVTVQFAPKRNSSRGTVRASLAITITDPSPATVGVPVEGTVR